MKVCQWRISKTSIIISGPKTRLGWLTCKPHVPPLYGASDYFLSEREKSVREWGTGRGVHGKSAFTEQRWVIDSGAGRGKLSGGARELDVLQLLEAKPLAVDRHPEVAQVDGVLGTGDLGAHHRVRCRPPRTRRRFLPKCCAPTFVSLSRLLLILFELEWRTRRWRRARAAPNYDVRNARTHHTTHPFFATSQFDNLISSY